MLEKYKKLLIFFVVFVWLLSVIGTILLKVNLFSVLVGDFSNYYVGGVLARQGGGNLLYNHSENYSIQSRVLGATSDMKNIITFRSPPFVATLFSFLTQLSPVSAFKIFAVLNLIVLTFFTYLSTKIFGNIKKHSPLIFLIALLYPPVVQNFQMGQTSLLMVLVLFLIFIFFKNKKFLLAGLISPLLLIKTRYLVFLPFLFLLSKNKKKYFLGALTSFYFLFLVSVKTSGFEQVLNYPVHLLTTESLNFGSRPWHMYTLHSLLTGTFLSRLISVKLAYGINAVLYFVSLYLFAKKCCSLGLQKSFVVLTVLSLAFCIHALGFDLCFLLVPIFILFNEVSDKERIRMNVEFFFAILLLLIPGFGLLRISPYSSLAMLVIGYYFLGLSDSLSYVLDNSIGKTK